MTEQQITTMMKSLGLSRAEAIELIQEDEAIDKMTVKEAESDLTPEQKKAIKKAKGGARSAVNAYGKEVKVNRKADPVKESVITELAQFLNTGSKIITKCEVSNKEREINFTINGENFTLTLVKHRPKKNK